jgi:hypothetical protein
MVTPKYADKKHKPLCQFVDEVINDLSHRYKKLDLSIKKKLNISIQTEI